MRHDQVAVGDDTYETTALPAIILRDSRGQQFHSDEKFSSETDLGNAPDKHLVLRACDQGFGTT